MTVCVLILCGMLQQAAPANLIVQTMDGLQLMGKLQEVTADGLAIQSSDGATQTLSVDSIQSIRFAAVNPKSDAKTVVLLVDGSEVAASEFTTTAGTAYIVTPSQKKLQVPIDAIAGVLFVSLPPQEFQQWKEKSIPPKQSDALVVRREDKTMQLEGIIGDVESEKLTFVLDGDSLPVNREKLHSAIFAHETPEASPEATVADIAGSRWMPHRFQWKADGIAIECVGQLTLEFAWSDLAEVDLGSGRIIYLSDLEPSLVQHRPFFDEPWQVCRDENNWGEKLQILNEQYDKGLAVHSKTTIEYETQGQFERFESMVGIDKSAGYYGDAIVRIRVDSVPAFEARVRPGEPPIPVSIVIDTAKAVVLEVDYGEFLDLGDWVVFGNARFVRQ